MTGRDAVIALLAMGFVLWTYGAFLWGRSSCDKSEDSGWNTKPIHIETYEQWKQRTGITDEDERAYVERRLA